MINKVAINTIFDSIPDVGSIKKKTVQSSFVALGGQGLTLVISMVGTAITARILTPGDFGIIAMVSIVINFIVVFKDAGLSLATIQKEVITHRQISALFWVNSIFTLILSLVVVISGPIISKFYGNLSLTVIVCILSIPFLLSGLTIQHTALLNRSMRFDAIYFISILSQLTSLVVVVIMGLKGYRHWSLIVGAIVNSLVGMVTTFYFVPWKPSLTIKGNNVREMIKFGKDIMFFNFMNYFSRNLDKILIGKYFSQEQLGLYNKSYQFLLFPLNQIRTPLTRVLLPVLSSVQNSPDVYRKIFLSTNDQMLFFLMPATALIVASSDWIVQVVLGSKWIEAVPIIFWLSLVLLFQVAGIGGSWLFITQGRTRELTIFGAISSVVTILSFLIGIYWGATGVAAGYAISSMLINTPLYYFMACKRGHVSFLDYSKILFKNLLFSFFAIGVLILLKNTLHIINPVLGLILSVIVYITIIGGISLFFPNKRKSTKELYTMIVGKKN